MIEEKYGVDCYEKECPKSENQAIFGFRAWWFVGLNLNQMKWNSMGI